MGSFSLGMPSLGTSLGETRTRNAGQGAPEEGSHARSDALMHACERRHTGAALRLLEEGADVEGDDVDDGSELLEGQETERRLGRTCGLANGWAGPPGVYGDHDYVFSMRLSLSTTHRDPPRGSGW